MLQFGKDVERWKSELTLALLRCISSHLSGREDCREVEYQICITDDRILMNPQRVVFPSVYKRKESDKVTIVGHVVKDHFPEHFDYIDNLHETHIRSNAFVKGHYVYKLSSNKKQRRWEKVR